MNVEITVEVTVRIGDLAGQTGASVRALRYYAEQELIAAQRASKSPISAPLADDLSYLIDAAAAFQRDRFGSESTVSAAS